MRTVLGFLGLIDSEGNLSRTNLAVWIALAGMISTIARGGEPGYGSLGTFIVALGSYQLKRYIVAGVQAPEAVAAVQAQADATAATVEHHKAEVKVNVEQLIQAGQLMAAEVKNMKTALKARGVL